MSANSQQDHNEDSLLQKRLQALVREENRRLDRLIARLYLKFTPGYYESEGIYDHICRSVAEYFEAQGAELYLKDYEDTPPSPQGNDRKVRAILQLRGAAGPWERALRPKYFRKKPSDKVLLPDEKEAKPPNLTAHIAQQRTPLIFESRNAFQKARKQTDQQYRNPQEKAKEDSDLAAHQVVWDHTNLYSVSRNIAGAPLRRSCTNTRNLEKDIEAGALKVENKRPSECDAFKPGFPIDSTYLRKLWCLVALRPYLDDVIRSPNLSTPLGNNFSWRRRYSEIPSAKIHFDSLRAWLSKHLKEDNQARAALRKLSEQISGLVNFVTEAETILAQLERVRAAVDLCLEGTTAQYLHRASCFNLISVATHCTIQKKEQGTQGECSEENCPIHRALDGINLKDIASEIESTILGNQEPQSLVPNLLSEQCAIEGMQIIEGTNRLLQTLGDLARQLSNACSSWANPHPALAEELARASDIAENVLKKATVAKCQLQLPELLKTLAESSSEAAMYSHTFSPTNHKDRVRLMYVANHVMQVLDQQLLRDARRMGISAGSDDIVFLKLSPFHLSCLCHIKAAADEVMEWLAYEVYAHAASRGEEVETTCLPFKLTDFLQYHRDIARQDAQGDFVPLFRIMLAARPRGERLPTWEVTNLPCVAKATWPIQVFSHTTWLEVRAKVTNAHGYPDYSNPEWLVALRDSLFALRDGLRTTREGLVTANGKEK